MNDERDNPSDTRGDREENGRFRPGNGTARKGGRPCRSTEETYLAALREAVPLPSWKKAVRAVLAKAIEAGDARSLDLLARYLLPSPETRARLALERPREERPVADLIRDAKRMIAEIEAEEAALWPVLARGQREPEPLPSRG